MKRFNLQKTRIENFSFVSCFGAIFPAFSLFCSSLLISNKSFVINNLSQKDPFANVATAASSVKKCSS